MTPTTLAPSVPVVTDSRLAAYCAPDGPEIFSGVVHGSQIWTDDPFDVVAVHTDARAAFHRLLARASDATLPPTGKSLLLLGEGGSGKTHLMRAFRNATHEDGAGYCGYLQMLSRSENYARYVLSYLIDSLEQPYRPGDPTTGLARLARGLLDALDAIPDADRQKLCEDLLEPEETAKLVFRFADIAVQYPRFSGCDINLLRAMLFLLPNEGRIRPKVLNWLRCEDLAKYDSDALGGLVPRPGQEMPLKTIVGLGQLMHAVDSSALVLLVDQMEEMIELARGDTQPGELFRSAINTLIDIADALPNAVIVIGCLEELFGFARQNGFLPGPKLDRLEHDPDPIRLAGKRTADEVHAIVAKRLEVFFDAVGSTSDANHPLSPYTANHLTPLTGLRARDILDFFRKHHEECVKVGKWIEPGVVQKDETIIPATNFGQLWNDFHATAKSVPTEETKLADLLAWAIASCSDEMPHDLHFGTDPDDRFIQVDSQSGNAVDKLLVAICDKGGQGGGLKNQIEATAKRAGEIPAVFVRSTEFAKSPNAGVHAQLAKLCVPVGIHRKTVVANSDWRAMNALRAFESQYRKTPGFAEWRKSTRPLASLPSLRKILDLDKLELRKTEIQQTMDRNQQEQAIKEGSVVPPMSTDTVKALRDYILLGQTRSTIPAPVEIPSKSLCRHAAFLGGSGSGKTTAALAIIEQFLLAGVPAVLLDRKGDLARYADPTAWAVSEADADRAARRTQLRATIDITLYTPGADNGRPLAIPIVPSSLAQTSTAEREQIAQFAAAGLGVMMGYKSKGIDPKSVILQKAIETLAVVPNQTVTVKALQKLVDSKDDALLAQFDGQYEDKHFKTLATDLLTLSLRHRRLLEGGEPLDVDTILGRGSSTTPGKTRLSIINTQFLGDAGTTDFWVSQLLLALDRWRAKNPAPEGTLQAVLLFDEADLYLPAVGKPATKGPMEGLLKRARAAGIGLFLATQSPGDFDYRCRDQILTWLIGRVKESVAIGKLKPMLEAKPSAADKLADQKAGEFCLVREGDVQSVQAARNLVPTEQLPEDRILELARGKPLA